ncbi:MAG: peptide-methionine (R)-S-oxide reductase MsrB [Chitinophagales bacterium]
MQKSNDDWKKELSPEQYKILREKGTEAPFTGKYNLHWEKGTYKCGACQTPLFTSSGKYDAGCGWPSFHEPIDNDVIQTEKDTSHGRIRTEILCKNCGGHLGHVFNDGPTGARYCVNSLSLDFDEE